MSDFKKNGAAKVANGMTLPQVVQKVNQLATKLEEAVAVINKVSEDQGKLAKIMAMELGKMGAIHKISTDALQKQFAHLDLNVLATAEVLREVFGQLTQVDKYLGVLCAKASPEENITLTQSFQELREQSDLWWQNVTARAFTVVQERLAEDDAKLEAEKLKAKEAAEKAAKDKTEAEKVEAELRESEARNLATMNGGAGAEVPEGADVFGG